MRFVSAIDRDAYLAKYCLQDAWNLFEMVMTNESMQRDILNKDEEHSINDEMTADKSMDVKPKKITVRSPTHYFGNGSSVLDYILLSCEFDASYHDSFYQVSDYHTYDRHLINPIFERDGESTDHGIVSVTLTLRS